MAEEEEYPTTEAQLKCTDEDTEARISRAQEQLNEQQHQVRAARSQRNTRGAGKRMFVTSGCDMFYWYYFPIGMCV